MTERRRPVISNSIDDFPADLLAALGELIARWGYLHFQMCVMIREVCGLTKEAGWVLLISADLSVLCNELYTLTKTDHWVKDDLLRGELNTLAEAVKSASKNRNNFAHGVFGHGHRPGQFVRIVLKGKIIPEEQPMTVKELKLLSVQAHDLWERAQDVTVKLKASKRKRD